MIANKWAVDFLRIAEIISEHSTCVRKKVGAILVKEGRILSLGYNGVPSGAEHCNEMDWKLPEEGNWKEVNDCIMRDFLTEHNRFSQINEIHAEQNCLGYCSRNGISTEGAAMFSTLSPCTFCAKLLLASVIKEIYFDELYDREQEGLGFLINNKIKLFKFNAKKFEFEEFISLQI